MKTTATPVSRWALVAALFLWIAISSIPLPRPTPAPATAPAQNFSAARALNHVRAMAQKPHPPGTPEHDRVRDYVRDELTKLGLAPEVEAGFSEFTRGRYHASANVENLVARLPGTANTRPVMLVAHYDSTPRGPGASDDAHGVAVLLETLRALGSGPVLRNDVIFLITDGEEKGLLGAIYFMGHHPWRKEPGVVLNFEARGTSGNAFMFETSRGNEWMIRNLQAAVPRAFATSFAYEVYRRMPNDTDLTVFKYGGLAGMNFAFIEHPEFYHTPQDSVEHLDPVSLQEQGRYALSLGRQFGGEDLTERHSGDAVYFPTLFTPLIVYPAGWAVYIAAVTLAALLAILWVGLGRRARGTWMAAPMLLLAIAEILLAAPAPGASYLLAWPLLAGTIALAILVTAPQRIEFGWRVGVMVILPVAVFQLLVPLLSTLVIALGWKGAAPILGAVVLLMVVCVSPQLALAKRG